MHGSRLSQRASSVETSKSRIANIFNLLILLVPQEGFEPPTPSLRISSHRLVRCWPLLRAVAFCLPKHELAFVGACKEVDVIAPFSPTNALLAKTKGQSWKCQGDKEDRYGRLLATCFVDGEDIDGWLVRDGWALSLVRYRHRRCRRESRPGICSGAFIAPWEWRSRNCKPTILALSPFRSTLTESMWIA